MKRSGERLAEVESDPAFEHLPAGDLELDENYDALSAYHLAQSPNLDGDFAKWQSGPMYNFDKATQISVGKHRWKGPAIYPGASPWPGTRALLYVGVDVTDPDLYQPFSGRDIKDGDTFGLTMETRFRKNYYSTDPTGDEYVLFFSPGNFDDVKPSIFSDEDYLPPHAHPELLQSIVTAWKKTPQGYSGDIAIPVAFFDAGKFSVGYEIGMGLSIRKVLRPAKPTHSEDLKRITLQSKTDRLFHLRPRNPSSYPRLVLGTQ